MTSIFHIAEVPRWAAAQRHGSYTRSTRAASLTEVGFIHCSFRAQVETVANYVYADWTDALVLLEIDPDRVPCDIRVENLEGGTERFPHIYGPLPTDAVVAVAELGRRGDGRWMPVQG